MSAGRPIPPGPEPPLDTNADTNAGTGIAPPSRRGPDLRARLIGAAEQRGADLMSRASTSLPVRCLRRFGAINGRDRALVMGGQAFTTLIPLLIVVAAVGSTKGPTALADRLAARFHVTGASAQAIRTLFERPPGATGSITIAGVVVLLFSLLSLTRSIQRTYEAAWRLPAMGVRGTLNGMTAIGLLIASFIVLSLLVGVLRSLPAASVFSFVLRVATNTAVWLVLQSLLLSRRVRIRRLLPGALAIGAGSAVLSLYSALWMPRLIENNAGRYGIIGITFALLTWLILVCFCVVVAAVLSAELGGAPTAGPGPVVPRGEVEAPSQTRVRSAEPSSKPRAGNEDRDAPGVHP
jgi:membrane protein